MDSPSPYLSVVATARNDDPAGNLLRRLQTFVNYFVTQCQRHQLPAELILVEWNPPADRPGLAQALAWPRDSTFCQVRLITVPRELHDRLYHADALPMFPLIARNVGIRRAQAPYILSTTVDVIPNDALFAFLAQRRLQPGRMYRVDRYDLPGELPAEGGGDSWRACSIHAREGCFPLTDEGLRAPQANDVITPDLGISLGAGWWPPESYDIPSYRWVTATAELIVAAPPAYGTRVLSLEIEAGPGVQRQPFELRVRDDQDRVVAQGWVRVLQQVRIRLPLKPGRPNRLVLEAVSTAKPQFNDHDPRLLSYRVLRCAWAGPLSSEASEPAFRAEDFGIRTRQDVTPPTAGIRFGRGWQLVGHYDGECYRWAGSEAVLFLEPPAQPGSLYLDLEPGPSRPDGIVRLELMDSQGQVVAAGAIEGRQRIWLTLPPRTGADAPRYTLRTVGDAPASPFHPPDLHYRLFQIDWCGDPAAWQHLPEQPGGFRTEPVGSREPEDVAPRESGLRFGRGWYAPERYDGEFYRWVGNDAELLLEPPTAGAALLSLDLEPNVLIRDGRLELEIRDEQGQILAAGSVERRQRLHLACTGIAGRRTRLHFVTRNPMTATATDPRVLNFRVFRCVWQPESVELQTVPLLAGGVNLRVEHLGNLSRHDVVDAAQGVRFGRGWYPPESQQGNMYRWVSNDAVLVLEAPESGPGILSLIVEPGPGVCYQPFELQVLDQYDQLVARGRVDCAQRIALELPLRPGQRQSFRLHTDIGGQCVPPETRVLDYRVFRFFWSERASLPPMPASANALNFWAEDIGVVFAEDVAPVAQGIRFGRGWYPPEAFDGDRYRWAGEDAVLVTQPPAGCHGRLCLEIESGPGVEYGTLPLQVLDARGQTVAQGWIYGRQRMYLTLPLEEGRAQRWTLRTLGGGRRTPEDPRLLNFRLLRAIWTTTGPTGHAAPQPDGAFNCVTEFLGTIKPEDVAEPNQGFRFAWGWYTVEKDERERYRWAGEDAVLVVQPPTGPIAPLALEIEPGPGVGNQPFDLHVRDGQGRVVAQGRITGRQIVHLQLPLRSAVSDFFVFHVPGGGKTTNEQPRCLNFRMFHCDWLRDPDLLMNYVHGQVTDPFVVHERGARPRHTNRYGSTAEFPILDALSAAWERWRQTWQRWFPPRTTAPSPAVSVLPAPVAAPTAPAAVGQVEINAPEWIHLHSCSSFTMMAREHWFDLRGNPEMEICARFLDILLCYMAHYGGATEEMLPEPMRVYHQQPEIGAGYGPECLWGLLPRLRERGVPILELTDVLKWATEMRRRGEPKICNSQDWGLANEQLPETVIGRLLPRANAA